MTNTPNRRQFTWSNFVIGIIGIAIITIIWILHINGAINETVFLIGSFVVIVFGIVIRAFLRKNSRPSRPEPP